MMMVMMIDLNCCYHYLHTRPTSGSRLLGIPGRNTENDL